MRICLVLTAALLFSCFHPKKDTADTPTEYTPAVSANAFSSQVAVVTRNAELPAALSATIQAAAKDSAFMDNLRACLATDRHLRELVDKQRPLPANYAPSDLVVLKGGSYRVNREGMTMRTAAAESLSDMAAAARAEGITLLVSSAYRSYEYQDQVYNRIVREMGTEAADRESARPGHSQHQTGLVVDFGSIDDSFAQTAAGRWMTANASRFGWSLSYPNGYEAVTGYRWESWHYRYVGVPLADFIDRYFDGIQQYALRFFYVCELLDLFENPVGSLTSPAFFRLKS
jgi:D-alanyl-D-alanine carboxypeptidase